MAEEKMISVEKMDEILKDYYPESTTVDFHGQELVIRDLIDPADFFELVRRIADGCFSAEGEYMPEVYEMLLRAGIIDVYSNVHLPHNPKHLNRFVYAPDLYNTVVRNINRDQYNALCDAIWERISARKDANRVLFETEIQRAVAAIQNLGEQFSQLVGEVSPEDVKALVEAIGEGGIDEEKLVSAVVEKQNALREQTAPLEVIEGGKDGE